MNFWVHEAGPFDSSKSEYVEVGRYVENIVIHRQYLYYQYRIGTINIVFFLRYINIVSVTCEMLAISGDFIILFQTCMNGIILMYLIWQCDILLFWVTNIHISKGDNRPSSTTVFP